MAEGTDVLLKFCEEYWDEMRHTENQRSTMTNIVIVISFAVIGFISQKGISQDILPLGILLALLGLYGTIMTAKLYERHQFGQTRLNHWYIRIDELHPDAQFLALRDAADAEHRTRYPKMAKVHLHHLWYFLHISITLLGIVISVLIVLKDS